MYAWALLALGAGALYWATRYPRELPAYLQRYTVTKSHRPNVPPAAVWPELERLHRFVSGLERAHGPVKVNSGFRSPAVNAYAQGSPGSLHLEGRAVDLVFVDRPAEAIDLFEQWISAPHKITGLIQEVILHDEAVPWLHIGLAAPGLAPTPRFRRTTG